MSWSVDVPFLTISVKNTRPEGVKLAKIAKNSGFSRLELVRARTFERKVIETWLQAQMKCLGPQMCLLTISVKNTRPEGVKFAKIAKTMSLYGLELLNGRSQRLELVRARTFERKVIETTEILENDFGGVGACSCSLNTCYFCFATNINEDIGI